MRKKTNLNYSKDKFTRQTLALFGERLEIIRKSRGFDTAAEFARSCGVERHAYRAWETGRNSPDLQTFAFLCKKLGVEPNQLLPQLTEPVQEVNYELTAPERKKKSNLKR